VLVIAGPLLPTVQVTGAGTGIVKGYVKDGTSAPIQDALLEISSGGVVEASNSTNASGYFEIVVPEGTYDVLARATGYDGAWDTVTVVAGSAAWKNLTLQPDTVEPDITFLTASPLVNISAHNELSVSVDLVEDNLMEHAITILEPLDSQGNLKNYTIVRYYSTSDYGLPHYPFDDLQIVSGSSAIEWNATPGPVEIGDGSSTWNVYGIWPGGKLSASYYNNSNTTPRDVTAEFNVSTGALASLILGSSVEVDLADSTGRIAFYRLRIEVDLVATSPREAPALELGTEYITMDSLTANFLDTVPWGTYTLLAFARDFGFGVDGELLTFDVDTEPPVAVAGTYDPRPQFVTLQFDGTASHDNVGIVEYNWTTFDGCSCDPLFLSGPKPSYAYEGLGEHKVYLNLTDGAGNMATDVIYVMVTDGTPPIAVAGDDITVAEGEQVQFNASKSFDNVNITSYVWTFEDGGPQRLEGMVVNYTFDTMGKYNVTLNASDEAGYWSTDTLFVTVKDGTPPTADAGADITVVEGEEVFFNGSGSSDNLVVTDYIWTFDDNGLKTLFGPAPSYIFAAPGSYNVTLTVEDGVGLSDTDNLTVTVMVKTFPPEITSQPPATADEGVQYIYQAQATDADGDTLEYILTIAPGGMVIDTATGLITWTPASPHVGEQTVILEVRDGAYSTVQNWNITVRPKPAIGIRDSPDGKAVKGKILIEGTASVESGQVATVFVALDNESFVPVAGTSSWSFELDTRGLKNGWHEIRFKAVSDNGVESDVHIVRINVKNAAEEDTPNAAIFILGVILAVLIMAAAYAAVKRSRIEEEEKGEEGLEEE
jgi:PKD repeat protein